MSEQRIEVRRHRVKKAGAAAACVVSRGVGVILAILVVAAAIAAYEGITSFVNEKVSSAETVTLPRHFTVPVPKVKVAPGGFTAPNWSTP
jgi:hypothetical protein